MKKIVARILVVFLAFTAFAAKAQIIDPVKWTYEYKKISATEGELVFKATIEKDWHLYSQYNPPSKDGLGGAMPLKFTFTENANYELVGKTFEPPYKKEYSDVWEVDEYYFTEYVEFTQKIKLKTQAPFSITGNTRGQVCKDICIETGADFNFNINSKQ